MAPATLRAEDKAAEASMVRRRNSTWMRPISRRPAPRTPPMMSPAASATAKVASASQPATPLVPSTATWDSFHGQLNAQKYSPLKQITADNVSKLKNLGVSHR